MVAVGDFLELSPISGVSAKPLNDTLFLVLIDRLTLSQVDSKKVSKWKQQPLKRRHPKVGTHASAWLYCLPSPCSRSGFQPVGWLQGDRNERAFIHISVTSADNIVSAARCNIQDVVA